MLLLICPILLFANIISSDEHNYYINTVDYSLRIEKENGKITSAKLASTDFELVCDYPLYGWFFTEYGPEDSLTTAEEHLFFYPPKGARKYTSCVRVNTDNLAVLDFIWDTEYISTSWSYKFLPDKPFFIVDINRYVNTSYVYSNAQQCVMYSRSFDDTYIIDYSGNLDCTMLDGSYTYPASATSQHSMYSAIDNGMSEVFPMMGWHQDENNIVSGVITTYVSPNQRKTISYHGGGRYNHSPGFSEGQWNWFGKSDSESIFLKQGLNYGMRLYYFLDNGDIDELLEFNQELFNEDSNEYKHTENYYAASLGGRSYPSENYFWRFPQVSSDYICSQELFRHRAFAIPCSQNGTRDTHIFNLYVKELSNGTSYDLTPIYGIEPLFCETETIQEDNYMVGSMSWKVNSLKNKLSYKAYEGSDKVSVSGQIIVLEDVPIKDLYVEFELSPRVTDVVSVSDSIYDIRCNDEVYNQIGIAVYNIVNIEDISIDEDKIKLNILKNSSGLLYSEGDVFYYHFTLFPHVGYNVQGSEDITTLISAPNNVYREDCVTFPDQLGNNSYGIYSNPNLFVYNTNEGPDSLLVSIEMYNTKGKYPVKLHIDAPEVKSVIINNEKQSEWFFDCNNKTLEINKNWIEATNKIEIFSEDIDIPDSEMLFKVYPNPFNIYTNITFELPQEENYTISVFNIKGQLIRSQKGFAKKSMISWDGKDSNQNQVASGIYFCEIKTENYTDRKKMLLLK